MRYEGFNDERSGLEVIRSEHVLDGSCATGRADAAVIDLRPADCGGKDAGEERELDGRAGKVKEVSEDLEDGAAARGDGPEEGLELGDEGPSASEEGTVADEGPGEEGSGELLEVEEDEAGDLGEGEGVEGALLDVVELLVDRK